MSVVDPGNVVDTNNVVGPSIRGYCRVCGTVADDLLSIYQNEIVQELPTKLTTYLPIKISTTDVFPVEICLDCTNGVQNWHLLYQSCLYADSKFREMLEYEVKQQAEQLADKSHNSGDSIEIIDNHVLVKDEPSETRVNDAVQLPLELKQEIDLMDYSVHEVDIKATPECQLVSYTVQEIEENHSDNESIVECFSSEPIEIDDSDDETDLGEPSSSIVKEEVDLGVAVYGDGTTSRIPPSRQAFDIGKDDEEIDSSKSERRRRLFCGYSKQIYTHFDKDVVQEIYKNDGPYTCYECQIPFWQKLEFAVHLLRIHGKLPASPILLNAKLNIDTENYKLSKIKVNGKTLYECSICGKVCNKLDNLRHHKIGHSGIRPYICYFCKKDFRYTNKATKHIRDKHLNSKDYNCNFCSKSFAEISCIATHLRAHKNENSFYCNLCDTMFYQKEGYETHILGHASGLC